MSALREVIALYQVDVDATALKQLDVQLRATSAKFNSMASYAAAGMAAVAFASYKAIDAASDVVEQLNVINNTFSADGARHVLGWSKQASDAMGRSMYDLQKAAGQFGAFLEPQFRGTSVNIAQISEQLAGLAVDLGSFYNVSDSEAQMRLFSGLSGETEAVRRLGIDISDTALDAFNKAGGAATALGEKAAVVMKKPVAALTLQEKTLIRYAKIMTDTTAKQGDAARTAGGWANSLKRVGGKLQEAAVAAGERLLPMALDLLNFFEEKLLPGLTDLVANTQAFKDAILVTVSAFVAFKTMAWRAKLMADAFAASVAVSEAIGRSAAATKLLGEAAAATAGGFWGMASAVWAALWPVAALTAAFLALEDAWAFFQDDGRDTIFAEMVRNLTGFKDPLHDLIYMFRQLGAVIEGIGQNIKSMVTGDFSNIRSIKQIQDDFNRTETNNAAAGRAQAIRDDNLAEFQKNRPFGMTERQGIDQFEIERNRFLDQKDEQARAEAFLPAAWSANPAMSLVTPKAYYPGSQATSQNVFIFNNASEETISKVQRDARGGKAPGIPANMRKGVASAIAVNAGQVGR